MGEHVRRLNMYVASRIARYSAASYDSRSNMFERPTMHFSPVDPTQALPDELVRYMKIPTFLMLMEGKVFIPSLKTLQRTDPTEARLAGQVRPPILQVS